MRIADLRAFVMLADTGAFHAAAKQLHITQPTLTRRIQKLEETLDVQLVIRTTRQVRLTASGHHFLESARKIVLETDDAIMSLRATETRRGGRVRIACIPSLGLRLIPEALPTFRSQWPAVSLRVIDANAIQVIEQVRNGEVDFGLGMFITDDPDVNFHYLFREPLGIVCSAKHPIATQDNLRWEDLAEYPLASNIQQSGNWLRTQASLAESQVSLNWFHQIQSVLGALILVRQSDALAVVPPSLVNAIDNPDYVFKNISAPKIHRDIGLISHASRAPPIHARALMKLLQGHADLLREDNR